MRWSCLWLVAGLVGCADVGPVPDVDVVAAGLYRVDLTGASVVVGGVQGDAVLVWEEPDGTTGAMSVALSGPTVGLLMDVSIDPEGRNTVPIDLSEADVPLPLRDVFGTYRGTGGSVGVLLVGSGRHLRNRSGAAIREQHLGLGVGIQGGYQWLTIAPGGADSLPEMDDPDAEFTVPREPSGGGCHGPAGSGVDTGVDTGMSATSTTSGTPATGGASGDTGAARDTGGAGPASCGCEAEQQGCGDGACSTTGTGAVVPWCLSVLLAARRRR